MKILLILFLLFSTISKAQTISDSTIQNRSVNLNIDNEKYQDRIKLGSQVLVCGLVGAIVGTSVKADNIVYTGAGIFTIGVALIFSADKFRDSRLKVEGNGLTYKLKSKS